MKNLYLLIFLTPFFTLSQDLYFPPLDGDEWATSSMEELGWCSDELDPLMDYLQEKNTKAFIVLKDGKIVIEEYFDGFHADSMWYWASAGKCITSVLTGIAQEEGLLALSDKTSSYLGEGWTSCTPEQEDQITIWHQLTMTSGLDDGDDAHCTDPECLTYHSPAGERWAYHNGPYTLLGEVISAAAGMSYNLYCNSRLESGTGMSGFFFPVEENNVYFSVPRDMARFGLMVLNDGYWDETEIVNSDYVEDMINTSQDLNLSYGYLWWLNGKESFMIPQSEVVFDGSLMAAAPNDLYAAIGKDGQILNIVPSQNLMVVRMGEDPGGLESLVPTILNNTIWEYLNDIICTTAEINEHDIKPYQFYPNPVKEKLIIRQNQSEELSLSVYNSIGNLIFQISTPETLIEIDLSKYASGLYHVVINDGQISYSEKIILE